MTEQITNQPGPGAATPPLPGWLRQDILKPGEEPRWWAGPRPSPKLEWVARHRAFFMVPGVAGFFVLPLAGMGLCRLAGVNPIPGFLVGGLLGFTTTGLAMSLEDVAKRFTWQLVTNRRLLVVMDRKVQQEFDLDVLRRFLASVAPEAAAADGAAPRSVDDRIVDLARQGLFTADPKAKAKNPFADLEALAALGRVMGQMQGEKKGQG